MKNKLEEISNLITKARNQIELAMLELLDENNNDPIKFDTPICVANNEVPDLPGMVYEVGLDYGPNDEPFIIFSATWGPFERCDEELYYVSDFTTDDLEWILTRMYETL